MEHPLIIGTIMNGFQHLSDEQIRHLIYIKFEQYVIKRCTEGEKCLLCGELKVDNYHEISCRKNCVYLTYRHDLVVNAIVKKLNKGKHALPVSRGNRNKIEHGKIPDIEFENEQDGSKWIIDVQFSKPVSQQQCFDTKINKYKPAYGMNIIPIIIGYNGFIYKPSYSLVKQHLKELTDEFL